MAALTLQNNSLVRVASADSGPQAAALATLAQMRKDGRPFQEQAHTMPTTRTPGMTNVYYRTYATKDTAVAVACVSPGLQRTFIDAIGLTDAAHAGKVADPHAHYRALRERAEAALASRTSAAWKTVFDARGIPGAAVRFAVEMLDDEQARANGLFHDLAHPDVGTVRVLAPPLAMDGDGFQPAAATAAFGSEARAILGEIGFSEVEVDALLKARVSQAR
jgi:crotonobetainyl-CoA:carnitine CoA-transferase CaiB-like acyl-CoA transferase